jgi:hypothetical protein
MIRDNAGNRALIFLLALLLWPSAGFGFRLREISSLPLNKADSVFGQATDNIIIKKNDRLQILDHRHQFGAEIELDKDQAAVVDENGSYYALVNKNYDGGEGGDSTSLKPTMTIYNNRQMPLWSVYDLIEGDYYIGPSGDFVIIIAGTPGTYNFKMYIYHKERPVIEVEIESYQSLQFNHDGDYLLIDAGAKGEKLYNTDGELICHYKPQKMSAFAEEGKELVTYDYQGFLRIYDGDRKKLEIDTKQLSIKKIVFRKAISRLAIIYDFSVVIRDTHDGKTLWEYASGKDGGLYASLDISPNDKFVGCGIDITGGISVEQAKRHVVGYLFVFDIDGQALQELEFHYEKYSKGLPDVRFLPDNRTIMVRNAESLHFIEID